MILRKSAVYPSTMSASSDDKEISNLFATFFKTTYSTEIFNDFESILIRYKALIFQFLLLMNGRSFAL